jgi:2-iminoacetate synthase
MKIQFIEHEKLKELSVIPKPKHEELDEILNKALKLKGLSLIEVAKLLQINDNEEIGKLLKTADIIKHKIYGKRLVLFAPLYIGNICSNNCLYCAFRRDNKYLKRVILSQDEIKLEVESLLKEGHKRLLMLCGEDAENPFEYFCNSIRTAYKCNVNGAYIRRINVEIAPLEVEEFTLLKKEKIGTYVCFQETYNSDLYKKYHPPGPKADYEYRLTVMDRAMEGGIDDVGIGVLFGLADYKYDVLGIMEHAAHLEKKFGCGPHTVSVPRIQPALGAPLAKKIPYPVSDDDFKKIIAIIRIALPYTGIILTTRETSALRDELFKYGVSQISAGSRTNPGSYSHEVNASEDNGSQFSLGDHRSLDEVISSLIDMEHIPSFCTGCYRKGRVGQDFMDLAKPGLIQQYCMPNGLFTFYEYLMDYASEEVKIKGQRLVKKMIDEIENVKLKEKTESTIAKIEAGERDLYL